MDRMEGFSTDLNEVVPIDSHVVGESFLCGPVFRGSIFGIRFEPAYLFRKSATTIRWLLCLDSTTRLRTGTKWRVA